MSNAQNPARYGPPDPHDPRSVVDALRRSEARYRALVGASSQAVWSWSPGGANTDFQNTMRWWEEVTGQTVAEQERDHDSWLDVVHPDDRAGAGAAWGTATATGSPYDVEYRVRGKAGDWRHVKARGVPVPGPDGTAQEWVGTLQDVTEQRRAEAARRESEERFRGLVTATSDVVYRMSPDWSEMRHLDGRSFLSDTDGPNRSWLDAYIPPDERERVTAAVAAAVREKRPFELEHRVVGANGAIGWTFSRAIPILDTHGNVVEWFGAASDVTRRRQAEEDLRASRERLTAALRTARMCAWAWDPAADRTVTSDTAAEVYGLRPGEALDSSRVGYGLIHPSDVDRLRGVIERAVERAESWHTEFRIVRPVDGRVAWLEERATAVRDHTGAVRMTGLVWDVTERKAAEAEAARLTEKLQLALDAADLGTWEWDPATDQMTVSARASQIYGTTPGVPHGREVGRLMIHHADRERAREVAARAVAERTDYDIEYRLADRPVWVSARGRGVYDAAGVLVRTIGVVQDVTDRKRAEEELRDIRARMETALEAGAIGTWSWDVPGDRFYGDASLARIFSVQPEAVAGGPLSGLLGSIHSDDRERVGALVSRAVDLGGRYEADYRVADGAGGWRWVTARGRVERGPDGAAVRFPGVVIDVTDRKRAEEALERVTVESEQRRRLYEAVLSTTPDLAYVWGLDHRFTYANEGLLRMWGKTWDEAVGRNCLELGYEPWHAAMHDREIDQVAATKVPVRGEVPFTGTFGRRIYDYLLVPVLGAAGEVEAVAGITRDVTDRQRMEQELRDQDRKKDDFIALLAHELRNPLAPIRNGLQVLRMGGGNPEAAARARDMMDRQLTHMVRLIDDLLDVSRINRNKMELRRARVALSDVVASAVETARPVLDAADHELTVSLPVAPVVLDADLTRLAQVFSNLLTNSAKYTPKGGRVWLSAERDDGIVRVVVRDTGIGIPEASLPAVFDMFSQVDRSVEKSTGGLGIGLALVKGLVEMHGGTVAAASEGEGRGTTFTVTLPEAEQVETPAAPPASQHVCPRQRVLVVDDNRDGAESMADMLRLLGHEVVTAYDGLDAVERADAFRPDVILMDVGMPRLNGLDATRRIRECPWGRGVAIVALTGWGQGSDREESRGAGCDGHLVKPVDLADLQRVIAGTVRP